MTRKTTDQKIQELEEKLNQLKEQKNKESATDIKKIILRKKQLKKEVEEAIEQISNAWKRLTDIYKSRHRELAPTIRFDPGSPNSYGCGNTRWVHHPDDLVEEANGFGLDSDEYIKELEKEGLFFETNEYDGAGWRDSSSDC